MNEFLKALAARQGASVALRCNGARFIPGDDTLIVTFQPFTDADDPEEFSTRAVWAEKFVHKRGYSLLGINRQSNNWYRASDLHALLRALQQQGFFARFRRVMFYGGSMGGFAALAFAELAPGCTVLAHNPQTTLRPSETPWETRFRVALEQPWEGEFSDGAIGARAAQRVYVSYDPFDRKDSLHVARLDPANLVRLRVPMVGHQMPVWLLQMKLLGAIFDAALAGTLTSAGFRQMARARFELPHYLLNLAGRTRNPALRQYLGEKARGIAPQQPAPRDYLWALVRALPAPPADAPPPLLVWTVNGCRAEEVLAWMQALRPGARSALEPFSGRCKPHDLAVLFRKPSHGPMVHDEIQRLLSASQLVLHRTSGGSMRFEAALLAGARQRGFTHLLLHRRDAVARLVDGPGLPPVPADGAAADAWLSQRVAETRAALGALASLEAEMQAQGEHCHRLALESLDRATANEDDAAALATLRRLLGLAPDTLLPPLPAAPKAPAASKLSPETTRSLTEALAWVPTLDEGEAFLRAIVSYPHQPASAALDGLLPVLREQDSLRLSGLALTPSGSPQFTQLQVEQGTTRQDARWDQPSPGGPARFPGHPGAANARFGHVVVQADPRRPVRLLLRRKAGADALELARVEFQPLNRPRLAGLFLGPWSLGFKPLPGVASLALAAALRQLMSAHLGLPVPAALGDARQRWLDEHGADISGAAVKFAVLRDPVDRFTTLLRRRVVEPRLRVAGLPTTPSLTEFIEHFEAYLQVPALQDCFQSQAAALIEPAGFTRLFELEELAPLQAELLRRTGQALTLPARPPPPLLQRLGWSRSKLPADAVRWIRERYADDVALLATLQR